MNAGTSQRDVLTPMGHPGYPSVQSANQMTSRQVSCKSGSVGNTLVS